MALIRGIILVGGDWLKSRSRGIVIAERASRFFPRWAPEPPDGAPLNFAAVTAPEEQGIDLSWQNGTGEPAVTELWVSSDNVSFSLLVSLPLGTTSYKHMTGAFGALRYYKARHTNRTDDSAYVLAQATSQVDYPNAAPTLLSVTTPSGRPTGEVNLDLAWTNGDATAQTQVHRRPTGGGAFALVTTLAAGVATYRDPNLTPNVAYDYFVRHIKSGVVSAATNTASSTTLVDGPDGNPSALTATRGAGVSGQGKIALAWTNGDTTSQTYIYVATASGGALTFVSAVAGGVAAFTHDVGAFDVTRYYKVVHVKNDVFSNYSNESSANSGYDIPDADPSNLSATVPARPSGETTVNLAWVNGDTTAQTRVYRGGVLVHTAAAGVNTWSDTGRTPNTAYGYRVAHVKSSIESNQTAQVNATTLVDGPDAAPTNLVATNPGAGNVGLTWTNGDATATTEIYRSVSGGAYQLLTTKAAAATSHTDSPGGGVAVAYFVRHLKNSVASADSNTQSLTTLPPPATPSNVVLTGGDGRFDLTWTNGNAADPIKIYRNVNDGGQVFVADLAAGTTSYAQTGFAEDTKAVYYVSHAKNGFESSRVASAVAYTYDRPNAAPSALASTPWYVQANLTWTIGDSSGGTELYYRVVGAPSWTVVALSGATSSHIPSLTPGTNYQWFVRHWKTDRGNRTFLADSATVSFTTRSNPSGLSLTPAAAPTGETQLNAAWTNGDASAETVVTLVRNSDGATIASVTKAATVASHSFTGLAANTAYTLYAQHQITGPHVSQQVSVGGSTLVDGPNAAPSGLTLSTTGGSVRAQWTNGDATASTQMFRNGSLFNTYAPGTNDIQDFTVAQNTAYTYEIRHIKNGVVSSSVQQSITTNGPPPTPVLSIIARNDTSVTVRISGVRAQDSVRLYVRAGNQSSPASYGAGVYSGATSYDIVQSSHTPDYSGGYARDTYLEFRAFSDHGGFTSAVSNTAGAYTTNTPFGGPSSVSNYTPDMGASQARARAPIHLTDGNLELRLMRMNPFPAGWITINSWEFSSGSFVYGPLVTDLPAGHSWKWTARVYRQGSDGVYYYSTLRESAEFTLPTGPTAAPSGLSVSDDSTCVGSSPPCCEPSYSYPQLDWNVGDATSDTEVYRSDDGGFNFNYIGSVGAGQGSFVDEGTLFEGATYYYKVRHLENGIHSDFSNTVAFTRTNPCEGMGCGGLGAAC